MLQTIKIKYSNTTKLSATAEVMGVEKETELVKIRRDIFPLLNSTSITKQFYFKIRRVMNDAIVFFDTIVKNSNLKLTGITSFLLAFTNELINSYVLNGVMIVTNNQISYNLKHTEFPVLIAQNATNFN